MSGDWSFACPDWEDRLRLGRTPIADLPLLDQVEAEVSVALFDKLRLPDVVGQPTLGEVGGEWTRDIVRAAFGSIDHETGVRRVGEIFNLIPKKNSKTTNAAALGLVAMQMNGRPNIDGVIVGPTQEVADKCFAQACGMIEADPYLSKRFHVVDHKKTIIDLYRDPETGVRMNAKLKIKSFDLKVVTGSIPAFAIIDELHVMAQSSAAGRIIAQIRGGMITNPESLMIIITTQSDTPPAGVFRSELQYARGVRDGRITSNVRMLPVLYEFPEAMQTAPEARWRDPKNWPMVLPNLGRSVSIDRLADLYEAEREKGSAEERLWASQHLNVEIGLALHSERWRGADHWEAAAGLEFVLTLEELCARSEVVTVGIDGGGLDDLMGVAAVGRQPGGGWLLWAHAWCQPDVLEQRKDVAERLRDFEQDGDLTICASVTQDVEEAAEYVKFIADEGLLPEKAGVGLDPVGVAAMVDELADREIGGDQVVSVGQGFRLSGAVWGMERKLKDGTLRHAGSPMMAWCVGNAKAEQRGNAVLITKQAAGKAKIDPLVAGFNAFTLMSRNPVAAPVVDLDAFVSAPVMVI